MTDHLQSRPPLSQLSIDDSTPPSDFKTSGDQPAQDNDGSLASSSAVVPSTLETAATAVPDGSANDASTVIVGLPGIAYLDVHRKGFDYSKLDKAGQKIAREAVQKVKDLYQQGIVVTGLVLLEVKDKLHHGAFENWVKAEMPFTVRTAENYMKVAAAFKDKPEIISLLPRTTVYALAGASEEVRADIIHQMEAKEFLNLPKAIAEIKRRTKEGHIKPAAKTPSEVVAAKTGEAAEYQTNLENAGNEAESVESGEQVMAAQEAIGQLKSHFKPQEIDELFVRLKKAGGQLEKIWAAERPFEPEESETGKDESSAPSATVGV